MFGFLWEHIIVHLDDSQNQANHFQFSLGWSEGVAPASNLMIWQHPLCTNTYFISRRYNSVICYHLAKTGISFAKNDTTEDNIADTVMYGQLAANAPKANTPTRQGRAFIRAISS